jgi:hypothetical protein
MPPETVVYIRYAVSYALKLFINFNIIDRFGLEQVFNSKLDSFAITKRANK